MEEEEDDMSWLMREFERELDKRVGAALVEEAEEEEEEEEEDEWGVDGNGDGDGDGEDELCSRVGEDARESRFCSCSCCC